MRAFTLVAVAAFALVAVQAQAPIPYRPDGYQIGGPVDAPIVMDAFVDLLCPDCAAAWPNIKAVADYYKSNISVAMHTFPLPYHANGFMAAQAAHVAMDAQPNNVGLFRQIGDLFFNSIQSQFWNSATADQTFNAITADMGKAMVGAGVVNQGTFDAGMQDGNINNEARVSWKFACSKGVLGTPTFFVNGVNVAADPSWTLSDWRSILDPLLAPEPMSAAAKLAADEAKKPHHGKHHGKKHHGKRHHDKKRHHDSKRHHERDTAEESENAAVHKPRHHGRDTAESSENAAVHHKKTGCQKRGLADRVFVAAGATCPPNEPACVFLPGKQECCFPGEMCIPNVGCRC